MRSSGRLDGGIRLGATTLVLLAAWCRPAHADTPAARKAAAESLFQRGVESVQAGNIAEGCRQFEASQELDPALGTMLHLGDCYEREGRTGSAWAMFQEARSLAEATAQEERQRLAAERATALESKLSYVVIRVVPLRGLLVTLNGTPIPAASWGVPLPVDPGKQRVVATAAGHAAFRSEVLVPEGPGTSAVDIPSLPAEKVVARVGKGHIPSSRRAQPTSPPEHDATQRTTGFVATGVGIAGMIGGGVLGLLAMQKNDESFEHCSPTNTNACSNQGVRLRQDARDLAGAATVTTVLGASMTAAGVILVVTSPGQPAAREVVVAPSVQPAEAAIRVRGRF